MCTWLSSPCSGASPDGWQFLQRGESKTVQARRKAAWEVAAFEESSIALGTAVRVEEACCDQASELAANTAMANPPTRKAERFRLMFFGIVILVVTGRNLGRAQIFRFNR